MALVSVGIPTYNRAERLRRAAESVLGQTHRELELIISDNASTDATARVCEELRAADPRVRVIRAPRNRGLAANFNAVIAAMTGEYALLLSDDDWFAATYVERCLAALLDDPRRAIVCGRARYVSPDGSQRLGGSLQLESADVGERLAAYLRGVEENGLVYGITRRATMVAATPMENVLANDWLFVARILATGTAVTLEDTAIFRDTGGSSASLAKLATTLGLPRIEQCAPHLTVATALARDILWRAPSFRSRPPLERVRIALAAARAVIDWRSEAWFMTLPAAAALGRRTRGGWAWRGYLAATRRLGATHAEISEGRPPPPLHR